MKTAVLLCALMLFPLANAATAHQQRECTVDVGAPLLSFQSGLLNLGGCTVGIIDELSTVEALDLEDPVFCTLQVDRHGDGIADEGLRVGDVLKPGFHVLAFCNAGVALQASVTIDELGAWR